MKYGVRNSLQATVTKVKKGDIMAQMDCKLEGPIELSSVLTCDSVADLNLKEGDKVMVLIKAIHVIPVKE
ncbi:MAG: TOBE domain-containing protein [Deltaproteobacteria bacterium]|jgi:molybdate transport system regulatory protein|nr:TOBE domain-containing protein [Deltaproteobacteria bacterium]